MVTCRYCKEKIERNKAKKVGKSSYYHPECLKEKENLEKEKNLESQHYKDLIGYICEIFNIDAPTGMILKQIKEFREEPYNYKLSGMKLALQYFYETEDNVILEDSGIGIIPWVYERAKKHYLIKMEVEDSLKNFNPEEVRVVEVDSPKFNANFHKNINTIDICVL